MAYLTWKAFQIDDLTHLFYDYSVNGMVLVPNPDDIRWVQRNAKQKLGYKDDIYQTTTIRGVFKQVAHVFQLFKFQCGASNDIKITYKGYSDGTTRIFYWWNGSAWEAKFYPDMSNSEHSFYETKAEIIAGMDGGGYNYCMVEADKTMISGNLTEYSDYFSVEPAPMNDYGTPTYPDLTSYYLGTQFPAEFTPQVQGEYTVISAENTRDVRGFLFSGGEAFVTVGPAGGEYVWRIFVYYRVGIKSYGLISVSSPRYSVRPNTREKIVSSWTPIKVPSNPVGTIFIACYAGLYVDNSSAYIECDSGGMNTYWALPGNIETRSSSLGLGIGGDMEFKCLCTAGIPPIYGTIAWDV